MKVQVCAKTDVGLKRSNNEDNYSTLVEKGLFIVADGMGGHAAGEVASRIAIETVLQELETSDLDHPQQKLLSAVEKANQAVEQAAHDNPDWRGMGTTLSVLLLHQRQGYLAHVGDSRMYRQQGTKFEQMSDDHSLIGEQLRQGIITAKQAQNSSLGNILLQAIGITPELDICQKKFPLSEGDRYLLCSDGLSDVVSDAEIMEVLEQEQPINLLCQKLIDKALTAGGKDNITVLLIQID
ncbi:MAG: Stp1/IreP family PP2C-type Ser/Thr phosphatase [Deltaproteobacteria bacterium]|jgi:protein phosphatase|nr:Stp1/IreP family PP2C-type Ser/Thr phosphatase [Deltaproteobacteria bacterium]MCW8891768.1 Stp1/IreP family PP2C-type Ser/Thr phosphatase [Deltaproteobacteria bacterium]MCW9049631.1 Stp1/IreP family PP2C-type Ser/Thr phosphatase [Deltaproteobacteria bacterium]